MIVVIQCASGKQPGAGCLRTTEGKTVLFVAQPSQAPARSDVLYARPDDVSDQGITWREVLLRYNRDDETNPLGLYPACVLYRNPAYRRLTEQFGPKNTFILSAGWGLIGANFLTPFYDITFSPSADAYKRRRATDEYRDLCMLPARNNEDLYFFGGKDYVPLFCRLTANYAGRRTVFFNAKQPPNAPGCELRRFETSTRTNWQYQCVDSFLADPDLTSAGPGVAEPTRKRAATTVAKPPTPVATAPAKRSINRVWSRLQSLQGESFETITGKPFTFEISGNVLRTNRTRYNLSKADFAKALKRVPITGPGEISSLVRGSAYVWAILHDRRVRGREW